MEKQKYFYLFYFIAFQFSLELLMGSALKSELNYAIEDAISEV